MKKIFLILITAATLASCSDDLEKLNVNVKDPANVPGEVLFTSAQKSLVDQMVSTNVNDNIFRLINQYSIPSYDAKIFVEDRELADYYEYTCGKLKSKEEKGYKLVSNWIMTEILRIKSEKKISINEIGIDGKMIADLVDLISEEKISSKIAKDIFPESIQSGKMPSEIVNEKGLVQVSDNNIIDEIAKKVIENNPENVEKYKNGRNNLLGFFVGQVMKESKGMANPQMVSDIVKNYLEN